jgi:hypothetical protein
LTVTEDIEKIKQLTLRYITGHTMNDGELEAEGFAEDAVFQVGQRQIAGKETITKFAVEHAEMLKSMQYYVPGKPSPGSLQVEPGPIDGHLMVHPQISVDGDRATGNWMMYALIAEPRSMCILYYNSSTYDIEYIKRDGEWQIKKMIWTPRIGPRNGGGVPKPSE